MDPILDKAALRRRMRTLRRQLAATRPDACEAAAGRLPIERLPEFQSFSGYHPMGSEIDPAPLMRRLAETGAISALPAAERRDAPLEFREWDPSVGLEPDAVGVLAPPLWTSAVMPDLIITPLLAFDRRGRRLGQGGGHYDRTLANLRATKPVFVIGLAYAGQEVDALPDEPHDQRLDAILTDAEWIEVR